MDNKSKILFGILILCVFLLLGSVYFLVKDDPVIEVKEPVIIRPIEEDISINEWSPSRFYVNFPKFDENGKFIKWEYWQLEYNKKTLLLRPLINIKKENEDAQKEKD